MEYLEAQKFQWCTGACPLVHNGSTGWSRPCAGVVKLNCDAAPDCEHLCGGTGVVARDLNGVLAVSGMHIFCSSIE